MKKTMIILLTTVSLFGFTHLIFSQEQVFPENPRDYGGYVSPEDTSDTREQFELIRGRIISIDKEKNEIVIEEDQTHAQKTIEVHAGRIQYLNIGDHVRIRLKPGENKAENVKKLGIWHPHPRPTN